MELVIYIFLFLILFLGVIFNLKITNFNKVIEILNKKSISYKEKRQSIIDNLANEFHKHLNLKSFLS